MKQLSKGTETAYLPINQFHQHTVELWQGKSKMSKPDSDENIQLI